MTGAAFIGCGQEMVRADRIESYYELVNGFDNSKFVTVRTFSGHTLEFKGSKSDFEERMKRVFDALSP